MEKNHIIVTLAGITLFLTGYLLGVHIGSGSRVDSKKSQIKCETDRVTCELQMNDLELKIKNLCSLEEPIKVLPCGNLQICFCGNAKDMEIIPEFEDGAGVLDNLMNNLDPWKDVTPQNEK
jgi:hypothetical protein